MTLAQLISVANISNTQAESLTDAIEKTLSPATDIRRQLVITLACLSRVLPTIEAGKRQAFTIVFLEAHPFYAGQKILAD